MQVSRPPKCRSFSRSIRRQINESSYFESNLVKICMTYSSVGKGLIVLGAFLLCSHLKKLRKSGKFNMIQCLVTKFSVKGLIEIFSALRGRTISVATTQLGFYRIVIIATDRT